MSDHRDAPTDVDATLVDLERIVAEAKAVPLSASIMVNRADVEFLLHELRDGLPDELAQARWVVRERDEILERAQADAERLLADARLERDRLLSQEEVARAAREEAERVLGESREHARQIRLEAEDYVDAKLANFEVVLQKTLGAVERGRQKLRGRLDTDQLSDDDLAIEVGDQAAS
jgi:cell division septum initiation protein DivIVA